MNSHAPAWWLLVRAGAHLCAVPLDHVIEILRPQPLRRVMGVPAWIEGLAIIRGVATPVVDAACLLEGQASAEPVRRLALLSTSRGPVALGARDVIGVRRFDAGVLNLPPLLSRERAEPIEATGTAGAELLLVLRASCLVPEAAWQTLLEAGEA